jgi:hypothetical protein
MLVLLIYGLPSRLWYVAQTGRPLGVRTTFTDVVDHPAGALSAVDGGTVSTIVVASILPAPAGDGSLFPATSYVLMLKRYVASDAAVKMIGDEVNPAPN